jgi:hypothetical protein
MLRDQLLGAWTLLSCTGRTPSGRVFYPMGEGVQGRLLYTADGHVGVNLMAAQRPRGGHGTRFDALGDADLGPLARGYMAYSGPFEVDDERGVVRHHFELCLDPALIGTLQERHVLLEGDELELSVPEYDLKDKQLPMSLRWRRL